MICIGGCGCQGFRMLPARSRHRYKRWRSDLARTHARNQAESYLAHKSLIPPAPDAVLDTLGLLTDAVDAVLDTLALLELPGESVYVHLCYQSGVGEMQGRVGCQPRWTHPGRAEQCIRAFCSPPSSLIPLHSVCASSLVSSLFAIAVRTVNKQSLLLIT